MAHELEKELQQRIISHKNIVITSSLIMFENEGIYNSFLLKDKYGDENPYTDYMLNSQTFIPFCSFIMHWEDFEAMCEFFFPILFEFDRRHNLNMNADKYWEKAETDFRHDNKAYQARAMSFLAERLISCYMVCNMNVVSVKALNTKLGYYD